MIQINDELLDIEGIKKSNKPLLELFIRRTAVLTSTPESLVEKIVKDQWQRANKATQPNSSLSELDFCNMGTFFISANKAKKRIGRIDKMQLGLKNAETDPDEKINQRRKISIVRNEEMIKAIKFKTKQL